MWTKTINRLPIKDDWFIAYVGGRRVPLFFRQENNCWIDFIGNAYKSEDVERWLDDYVDDYVFIAHDDFNDRIIGVCWTEDSANERIAELDEMRQGGTTGWIEKVKIY